GRGRTVDTWRLNAVAWVCWMRVTSSALSRRPVSRPSASRNSPPLIPIRRWMRHTASSMPVSSSASRHASTCWYTLSTSVPSRSKRNAITSSFRAFDTVMFWSLSAGGTQRELRFPLETGEIGAHVVAETSDDATTEVEQPTARQMIESIAADGDERYAGRRRTAGGRRVVHRRQHFEPGLEVVIGVDLFRGEDRRPRQFGRLVHCLVRDSQNAANVRQVVERPEENFLGAGQRVPWVT